jgi:hypothetical protein
MNKPILNEELEKAYENLTIIRLKTDLIISIRKDFNEVWKKFLNGESDTLNSAEKSIIHFIQTNVEELYKFIENELKIDINKPFVDLVTQPISAILFDLQNCIFEYYKRIGMSIKH